MNYALIYSSLVSRARSRDMIDGYFETHHIIPRCIGGTDEQNNLVKLTPEEHRVAHLLLVKIYPGNLKLIYAANMMTNRTKNNKEFGWVRRKFADLDSKLKLGKSRTAESIEKQRLTIAEKYKNGFISPNLGKKLSKEHRDAISKGNTGKIVPERSRLTLAAYIVRYGEVNGPIRYQEDNKKKQTMNLQGFINRLGKDSGTAAYNAWRLSMSLRQTGGNNRFYGKTHSAESREKISQSAIGKPKVRTPEHNKKIGDANRKPAVIVKCPHCNKCGGQSAMKRWHFNNCKLKERR